MKIDTFMKIGHSHTICQDYILSGNDPCPFIILADGCSQAKDSDIGARLLCHTALKFLKDAQSYLHDIDPNAMGHSIIQSAMIAKNNFFTGVDCLDATLIIAYVHDKDFYVYMYGDGVVYTHDTYGGTRSYRRYYKPNAPSYLRYLVNGYNRYKDMNIASFLEVSGLCDQVENNVMEPFFHKFYDGDIKSLVIASDGVESFTFKEELLYKTRFNNIIRSLQKSPSDMKVGEFNQYDYGASVFYKAQKELDFSEVCKDMTDFKLSSGTFLKRRVKKVMRNYLKRGLINDDDLSIGCFYMEEY